MIDALGFKGIWEIESPDAILEQLCEVRDFIVERANVATQNWSRAFSPHTAKPPRCRALLLSDTIVLTITFGATNAPRERIEAFEGAMVQACGYVLGHTTLVTATLRSPLIYRGAIAVGDFASEDTFVLGPAVDAAASWMNEPEAASIILVPGETSDIEKKSFTWDLELAHLFLDYALPCKRGRPVSLRVMNPLLLCKTSNVEHDFVDGTKRAFARSELPSVGQKAANTLRLFEHARSVRTGGY